MVNLVVYFDSSSLPNRELWEKNAAAHRIPLRFDAGFEPANHPICRHAQVDHPHGVVIAKLGDATCQFQLDLYRLTTDNKEWFRGYDPRAFERYDSSAAFRWSEFKGADSLCAQLTLATLASSTNGAVLWSRAKGGFVVGEEAFETVCRSAFSEAKRRAGKAYKFSRRDLLGPVMNAEIVNGHWLACPRCEEKFSITSNGHWDGEKHLSCGQLIAPIPRCT